MWKSGIFSKWRCTLYQIIRFIRQWIRLTHTKSEKWLIASRKLYYFWSNRKEIAFYIIHKYSLASSVFHILHMHRTVCVCSVVLYSIFIFSFSHKKMKWKYENLIVFVIHTCFGLCECVQLRKFTPNVRFVCEEKNEEKCKRFKCIQWYFSKDTRTRNCWQ